jgi:hypothetical protein
MDKLIYKSFADYPLLNGDKIRFINPARSPFWNGD